MDGNASARLKLVIDQLFDGEQKAFSRRVAVSESTVSNWVNGGHGVKRSTLIKISRKLRVVNEDWLVNGYGSSGLGKQVTKLSQSYTSPEKEAENHFVNEHQGLAILKKEALEREIEYKEAEVRLKKKELEEHFQAMKQPRNPDLGFSH